jgi:hypothetical protein
VPAFGPRGALQVPQRMSGWLLSAKADLVREYVVNALRDHTELVTAATTVAVAASASIVLTLSAARPHEPLHERPARVQVSTLAVEHEPQYQAVAGFPTTPTPAFGPSGKEGEPGDRRGPNHPGSRDRGRLAGEDADDLGQSEIAVGDLGQNENAGDDPGQNLDQNVNAGDEHGKNAGDEVGQSENAGDDHGQSENAGHDKGNDGDVKGKDDDKGKDGDDQDGDAQGDDGDAQGDDGDAQGDESDAQGDESDGGDQATEATGTEATGAATPSIER